MGSGADSLWTLSRLLFLFIFIILRLSIRVFSRLANIFVLLAQGLERGSYEPDVTGSIPVWDMAEGLFSPFFQFFPLFLGFFWLFPFLFASFFLPSSLLFSTCAHTTHLRNAPALCGIDVLAKSSGMPGQNAGWWRAAAFPLPATARTPLGRGIDVETRAGMRSDSARVGMDYLVVR